MCDQSWKNSPSLKNVPPILSYPCPTPAFLYSNNQPLSEGLASHYSSILHTFASYDCKLPEKSRDLRGVENMARGKAGAGGMDTLERSERETKLAKVQPHVSFIFKFLLAFYWPENEIHCSPWPSVPWEFHLILCHFLFTALKLHWSYFNSLSVPSCSPPFHMS